MRADHRAQLGFGSRAVILRKDIVASEPLPLTVIVADHFHYMDESAHDEHRGTVSDGRLAVHVHQLVKDIAGAVLFDRIIEHVCTLRDGRIQSMEIRG